MCRLRRSCMLVRLTSPSSVMPELFTVRSLSLVRFPRYPSPVSLISLPVRKRISSWGNPPSTSSPASLYVIPKKNRRFRFVSGRRWARPCSDSWALAQIQCLQFAQRLQVSHPASVNSPLESSSSCNSVSPRRCVEPLIGEPLAFGQAQLLQTRARLQLGQPSIGDVATVDVSSSSCDNLPRAAIPWSVTSQPMPKLIAVSVGISASVLSSASVMMARTRTSLIRIVPLKHDALELAEIASGCPAPVGVISVPEKPRNSSCGMPDNSSRLLSVTYEPLEIKLC